MKPRVARPVVGGTVIGVGLATAVTPLWASTNNVSASFTMFVGLLAVIRGVWSLRHHESRNHWHLAIFGLTLAVSPWVPGFVGVAAACVAWSTGIAMFLLADAAYSADYAARPAGPVAGTALGVGRDGHATDLVT